MKLQPTKFVLTTTVTALLMATSLVISACGNDKATEKTAESPAQPIKQASTNQQQPPTIAGKKLYDEVCSSCHTLGVLGTPKIGDVSAWKPRIAKGENVLYMGVIHGIGDMPPRGGAMDASDEEIKATIKYIVEQSQ